MIKLGWRRRNFLRLAALALAVAVIGSVWSAVAAGHSLRTGLADAVSSALFFWPIVLVFGGLPVWLFNRWATDRARTRRVGARALYGAAVFGSSVAILVAVLALDGKWIESAHLAAILIAIAFGAIFGAWAEGLDGGPAG